MTTRIIVRLQFEGVHQWTNCNLPGVEFLKHPHRHIFFVEAKKGVTGLDREIEIITLKREIEDYLFGQYGRPADLKDRSCEMIATDLAEAFDLDYCSVLEDNENGSEVVK